MQALLILINEWKNSVNTFYYTIQITKNLSVVFVLLKYYTIFYPLTHSLDLFHSLILTHRLSLPIIRSPTYSHVRPHSFNRTSSLTLTLHPVEPEFHLMLVPIEMGIFSCLWQNIYILRFM